VFNNRKILAIIPARGGSKGLPGKNIKPLLGKPLIGWTIEQAKASKFIDEIFVSTDSREIADTAEQFGIKIPFLRPSEYSGDESPSSDFIIHTLDYFEKNGDVFDYLILLEPTSPLRDKKDIDDAIILLKSKDDTDGVISIGEVHMEHPMIVKKIDENGMLIPYTGNNKEITQRQMVDKAYFPYGVIYIASCDKFRKTKSFYTGNIVPYYIERWQNYEIDDIYDFYCIEAIMNLQLKEKIQI